MFYNLIHIGSFLGRAADLFLDESLNILVSNNVDDTLQDQYELLAVLANLPLL
jgi:hypothetical protein